jgi:hypothetical protein
MSRRTFLTSTAAVEGSLILRRSALGQDLSLAVRSSRASEQSETIRTAASHFERTLTDTKLTQPGPRPGGPPPGGPSGPSGGPAVLRPAHVLGSQGRPL